MWKNRIGYLVLWILAFALYIFYVGYTSYFLFLLVTIMPILSILYTLIAMRKLEVRFMKEREFDGEKEVSIHLYSRTNSIFPLARIQGIVQLKNIFTQEQQKEKVIFTSERKLSEVSFRVKTETCGYYEILLDRVEIYDVLGIVHLHKHSKATTGFTVYPQPIVTMIEQTNVSHHQEDGYESLKAGNDTGETFDVHSYRPGDSLHRIHWKLSAKLDDIMVREFSMPKINFLTIAYELYGSLSDVQQILGYVYGFSQSLLSQTQEHTITRYEHGNKISSVTIRTSHDVLAYMKQLLQTPLTIQATCSLPDVSNVEHAIFYIKKDGLNLPKKGEENHAE